MGLEPTTATLATWRSTTELHPRFLLIVSLLTPSNYKNEGVLFKGKLRRANYSKDAACGLAPALRRLDANSQAALLQETCHDPSRDAHDVGRTRAQARAGVLLALGNVPFGRGLLQHAGVSAVDHVRSGG